MLCSYVCVQTGKVVEMELPDIDGHPQPGFLIPYKEKAASFIEPHYFQQKYVLGYVQRKDGKPVKAYYYA
jgi:hypothetical protein